MSDQRKGTRALSAEEGSWPSGLFFIFLKEKKRQWKKRRTGSHRTPDCRRKERGKNCGKKVLSDAIGTQEGGE